MKAKTVAIALLVVVAAVVIVTYAIRHRYGPLPAVLKATDTTTVEGKVSLKDPLPDVVWTEGVLFQPYSPPREEISRRTGRPCALALGFCSGSTSDDEISLVLFKDSEVAGTYWMRGLRSRCGHGASFAPAFTKAEPVLCR